MARQTIITATEIKEYSILGKDFPACDILFISQFEERFFREIFVSGDLYKDMIADLVDYSNVLAFNQATTYAIGDKVKSNGKFYVKIALGTAAPPNNIEWEIGKKFKSDCFNDFYCNYLGTLLANHIVRSQMFLGVGKLSAQGLVKSTGDQFDRMSTKDYSVFTQEVDSIIQICYDNTRFYLDNTECLVKYRKNTEGCGCEVEIDPCNTRQYNGAYNFF